MKKLLFHAEKKKKSNQWSKLVGTWDALYIIGDSNCRVSVRMSIFYCHKKIKANE
jgi:hypothetical protein